MTSKDFLLAENQIIRVSASADILKFISLYFLSPENIQNYQWELKIDYVKSKIRLPEENFAQECIVSSFRNDKNFRQYQLSKAQLMIVPVNTQLEPAFCIIRDNNRLLLQVSQFNSESLDIQSLVIRIIREVFIEQYFSTNNGFILHSAAFSLGKVGVLLPGRKGAGKTTTLLTILKDSETELISNDRLILSPNNGEWCITGIPLGVRVAAGTFHANVKLSQYFSKCKFTKAQMLKPPETYSNEEKIYLTPGELSTALSTSFTYQASLKGLLFPAISQTCDKIKKTELSPEEVIDLLLHESKDNPWPDRWLSGEKSLDIQNDVESICKEIAYSIPAFRVNYGYQHAANGELIDALEKFTSHYSEQMTNPSKACLLSFDGP